jgi:hypothetical protein
MQALFGDLYTRNRRHALTWGCRHLHGQNLRDFYYHARSVPHDADLVAQIRAKAISQAQGIGGDPTPPPLQPLTPPPKKDSGGSPLLLFALLLGGVYFATRKKKK